jgi:hypothetical protein
MNQRLACLLASLALAAVPCPILAAAPASSAAPDVEILVNGAPIRRHAHNGRWYVEAVKGREYAIRLRNPYGVRVAVALSVDGLNTIDARQTTAADARKWVLDPYETVTISGWQTSRTQARRFEFTTEERSYGQALGKTDNLGVITAAYFKERVRSANKSSEHADSRAAAPAAEQAAGAAGAREQPRDEYAATGMGRATGHAVTQVWLDLEDRPAQSVAIRYEFRPQLVRLGILSDSKDDSLQRRERAQGFESGFCPQPPRTH